MFKIGDFEISQARCFVISEIGNNHNGSVERAIELIDASINAGADCVKFQMRNMSNLYKSSSIDKNAEDLGSEYIIDLLGKFELSETEHREIINYCNKKNILYLCTPWDVESADTLVSLAVPAIKVASADFTNLPFIKHLINTNLPLIISTGMSTQEEVELISTEIKRETEKFCLLHCNSTYPAPFEDINLNFLDRLKSIHPLVGYSGHERGIAVSIAAVAKGACVIERHITLDRNMEGPDHAASLEPGDFKQLIEGIRQVEKALGSGVKKVSQGELMNRENLGKSLIAKSHLISGHKIQKQDILIRSPGQGLSPYHLNQLVGKRLQRDMNEGDFFYQTDLTEIPVDPSEYQFSLKWGIPVRYHDFKKFSTLIRPDIFEFHLSYRDMDINLDDMDLGKQNADLLVHAPELFKGSHLLDLTAPDTEFLDKSIEETQRVIDIAQKLNERFFESETVFMITNIGGYTMDEPLKPEEKTRRYERFGNSLSKLTLGNVELIPQTMAPFPWHFGGQRYQNLFVDALEIQKWCSIFGLRICLDVSHSFLACNHYNWNFADFLKTVSPFTAHLHLADAKDTNGEGLQFGDGDINIEAMCSILKKHFPSSSFIPEIWQGHKNHGEGFWNALNRLNGLL